MPIDPKHYPHLLAEGFLNTSLEDKAYNCIAWAAAADQDNWWWPPGGRGSYWPPKIRNDVSVDAFVEMFKSLGFEECLGPGTEDGFEKVALYAKDGLPAHAARQLPSGKWTHKIGKNVDIQTSLKGVEDSLSGYGKAIRYFRRKWLPIS